ncbi:MAG: hypothetical protein HQ553_12445 [Chloroflexi bacterium]|nr:hypothetical protein [Chloroflexota bacterium]
MSYELNVTKESDHLYVGATGSLTIETLIALITNVDSLCIEHGYDRVLIDVSAIKGELDPLDSYMFSCEYLPGLGFDSQIKTAIIDLEQNRNRLQPVMHNARLRGLNMLIFSSAYEAMTWLDVQKQPVS